MPYPKTHEAPVTEIRHGQEIVDPYQWLEEGQSRATQAWTREQTEYTRATIARYPGRAVIRERLAHLRAIPDLSLPHGHQGTLVYQRRNPEQMHAVLYAERHHETVVIADPNLIGSGEPMSVDWAETSADGRYVVYGISEHGNEWSVLHLYDLEQKQTLSDQIPRARYSSIAFPPGSDYFFYTRYPDPGTVPAGEEFYHSQVFRHQLGAHYQDDALIFSSPDDKRAMPSLSLSGSGRYLLISLSYGWTRNILYVSDLKNPSEKPDVLFDEGDVVAHPLWSHDRLLLLTNAGSDTGRLVELSLDRKKLTTVVASRANEPMIDAVLTDTRIVIHSLKDAASQLTIHHLDGSLAFSLTLPDYASVTELRAQPDRFFYGYTGFSIPHSIRVLTDADTQGSVWAEADPPTDALAVAREWVTSKDGTSLPIFIVRRPDLRANGPTPTMLSGYGGFNVANLPAYSASIRAWVERGGIYALAILRGGSEFGEHWHRAGMMQEKQNVFDDFTAAARYLIDRGYTDSEHLGVTGRSNGGLLTGTFITQNPDLAKAAIIGVPLLDMIHYHRFLIADLWTQEYGSPDDPEQFQWLYAYSPYHHVALGTRYPATFLFTSEEDGRVDPMHARKMAALLQKANRSENPILLRVAEKAGHGAGKSIDQWLDEEADIWTFLSYHLALSL